MQINIIQTGSKGNAVLLDGVVLVDCGVSYSAVKQHAKDIKLVLLTHQHFDHAKPSTVRRLAYENPNIRWACCEWMLPILEACQVPRHKVDVIKPEGVATYRRLIDTKVDLSISPVLLKHDVPNCGWKIKTPNFKAIYATDTRDLNDVVAKDYDLYMIEGNYSEKDIVDRVKQKLNDGDFIYENRVVNTHLSTEQAERWIANNAGQKSKYILLHGHE